MEPGKYQHSSGAEPASGMPEDRTRPSHLQNGHSLGNLFRTLMRDLQTLLREQIRLVKMEASEITSEVSQGLVRSGIGGFIAYAGVFFVLGGVALLLGQVLPLWLSFSLTGLVVLGVGYALYRSGANSLQQADYALDRTTHTLQEDKQWIRNEAEQVKRDPSHLGSDR